MFFWVELYVRLENILKKIQNIFSFQILLHSVRFSLLNIKTIKINLVFENKKSKAISLYLLYFCQNKKPSKKESLLWGRTVRDVRTYFIHNPEDILIPTLISMRT